MEARRTGPAITITGLPGQWQETEARYDYASDKSHCPICGGVGWLWRGWFTCEGTCGAVAVLETGRVFLPVTIREDSPNATG
jgi:hypothetical protein